MRAILKFCLAMVLSAGLAACGSNPPRERVGVASNAKAADAATQMLGKPYRFGGATPRGFDCSGLVHYSYAKAGVSVPRSTQELRSHTHRVADGDLRKGDLLFFNQDGKRSSHVGIYVGGGLFVHAPSSGKRVRRDRLSDPYWQKYFVDARRF